MISNAKTILITVFTVPEIRLVEITDVQICCPVAKKAAVKKSVPVPVTPPKSNTDTTAEDEADTTSTIIPAMMIPTKFVYILRRDKYPVAKAVHRDTKANGIEIGLSMPLTRFPKIPVAAPTHGPAIIETITVPIKSMKIGNFKIVDN